MTNIDLFNICTGMILGRLYGEFPMKKNFTLDSFVDESQINNDTDISIKSMCFECFIFLQEEGYVSYSKIDANSVTLARLTQKGLATLQNESFGNKLKSLFLTKSTDGVANLIVNLFSKILG